MAGFRVAVVGCGITGLTAARRLRESGIGVVLIDSGFPLGGRIRTRGVDVPGFGHCAFDLGCLFLPRFRDDYCAEAPVGLPPRRFFAEEFGGQIPDWMQHVQLAVVMSEETIFEQSPLRPRGGMQALVNHLLPNNYNDEHLVYRTLTEVTRVEHYRGGWRLHTRHRETDGNGWMVGDPIAADVLLLTQPVPQALELLDASRIELPDGLRDELRTIRYDPCFVLQVAYREPTRLPAPVTEFRDGSPIDTIVDNHAIGTSPVGPALTVQATPGWSQDNWERTDAEVAAQLLATLAPYVSGTSVWHELHRWPRAYARSPIRFPYSQLSSPPLLFAGDSFANYAPSWLDAAFTSAIYACEQIRHLLSEIRRRQGGKTVRTRASLEVLVASEHDAIQAVSQGADRLLLCSAPEVGGLTPTPALLARVREVAGREAAVRKRSIPVTVMIRPRQGGYYYGAQEFALMREEARQLLELGADGIAFGVLDLPSGRKQADGSPDVRIERDACRELVELAHAKGKVAVFGRAFDLLPDRRTGLNDLIQLHCDRVLTSGGHQLAHDGCGQLAADVQFAGWDIEVVATGEITPDMIGWIVRQTGCTSIMDSFHRLVDDHSLPPAHPVAGALGRNRGRSHATDGGQVQQAVAALQSLVDDPDETEE